MAFACFSLYQLFCICSIKIYKIVHKIKIIYLGILLITFVFLFLAKYIVF